MPEIQFHIADVPISGIFQKYRFSFVYVMSGFAIATGSKMNVLNEIKRIELI